MKILYTVLLLIAVVAIAFFLLAPGIAERSMNKTIHRNIVMQPVNWYDSIPFIADLHCDALLWNRNLLKRSKDGHVDIPRMQQANAAFQVFTIVSKTPRGINIENNTDKTDQIALLSFAQLKPIQDWFSIKARALHQCEQLHRFAKQSNGIFRVITSQKELKKFILDRNTNHQLTAGMLGIEGAHCLEGDVKNVDTFFNAGVRYIGLTHFFDNDFGGSAHGVIKGGLTEKGKLLIDKMQEKHIIIDLAHASPQLFDEILQYATAPVIVSHTGVKGTCNNTRNLSDTQIDAIGKRNGLIGIGLWETAVCGTDAAATARAMRYVANRIGVDKVALGSDFDGAITASYDITGFPAIVNVLLNEGFSRNETGQMMGGNIRDFLLKNLPQ
ncbi:membrane dipeptidase [Hydrotalea sp.]|uniref:dipeptidase n=1 Tax=Hydrotalea sp. TaxID=2881279 RepID=UPI00263851EE|nr:membrane dipeptidase [Hydrotalea sp.]